MLITLSIVDGNQLVQIPGDGNLSVQAYTALCCEQLRLQTHDAFGKPLIYQLRARDGVFPLPQGVRLADLHLDEQAPFVLESIEVNYATVPLEVEHPTVSMKKKPRWGRRSVLSTFVVATVVGGLGAGAVTW